MPLRRILVFITAKPAISMAPQNDTSPSPCAGCARDVGEWASGRASGGGGQPREARRPAARAIAEASMPCCTTRTPALPPTCEKCMSPSDRLAPSTWRRGVGGR